MSSGRTSASDPLTARPIGVREVATITASGMVAPELVGSSLELVGVGGD